MNGKDRQTSNRNLVELFYQQLNEIKPDVFLEIGAFHAEASKHVSKMLTNCEVHAYEANPHNHEMILKELQDYSFEYINMAISNTNIPQVMNLLAPSSIRPNQKLIGGAHSLSRRLDTRFNYKEVIVNCEKLDNLFSDKLKKYALWIDAEGQGYNVLLGAEELLNYVECIFIEVESRAFWHDQKLDIEIIDYLQKKKFKVLDRDHEYPYQYNIIFVKS